MDSKEILKFCLEKGLLLDRNVFNLFSESKDIEAAKFLIEKFSESTRQKIITEEVLRKNREDVKRFFLDLPEARREKLENLKIRLGLTLEISRVSKEMVRGKEKEEISESPIKVVSVECAKGKKITVEDFVRHFRSRFNKLRAILQNHSELENLISISKISGSRQKMSLIGIVIEKNITKNKNIILEVEDLTGKIKILINKDKKELYEKAEEIVPDEVLGFVGSGSREIFFANEVVFPEAALPERKHAPYEEYVAFAGDLHFGSKLFMRESFEKFISYLNGEIPNTPEAKKIRYLFLVGDVISGVGNYPDQEKDLAITDLEEQFIGLAKLLGRIRKDIRIILSPGNHDCMRIMEPQPLFDEKYAWSLYEMGNALLTGNPAYVNLASRAGFSGFDILTYHGFSFGYYAGNVPSLIKEKAMHAPEKIIKYLLKNRHLAPTHSSTQYFPLDKDPLLIENIPDILVAAHTHKSAVAYYNNILIISVSSWEGMTPYEEKLGAKPDFCKVPLFNLKTREIRILDFEESHETAKKLEVKEELKLAKRTN